MGAPVAVVTDSTAYLPPDVAAARGVIVVPLQVVIAGRSVAEPDVTAREVMEALRSWRPVSTSRPAPETFAAAYAHAAERGAPAVVSVHLSARMSGTVEAATLAARDAPVPVDVVDSRSLGMGMGFAVLDAARVAAEGGDVTAVADAARRRCLGAWAVFYVDTLEHLRRGGRIGAAQALLGSALAVKPLLQMVDGHIAPLEKVRTASRAMARLEDLVADRAGGAAVDLAVHHLGEPGRAGELAGRLRARVPSAADLVVAEVGAVVGAHVGPGMLAVVVSPRA